MRKIVSVLVAVMLVVSSFASSTPAMPKNPQEQRVMFASPDPNMLNVFKQLNYLLLKSNDSASIKRAFAKVNSQLGVYIRARYGELLYNYFSYEDPMFTVAAMFIAHFESIQGGSDDGGPQTRMAPNEVAKCILQSIGLVKGLDSIVATYEALLNGSATFSTIFGFVKTFIRRYVGWFAVAITVYEFGDCMNWW